MQGSCYDFQTSHFQPYGSTSISPSLQLKFVLIYGPQQAREVSSQRQVNLKSTPSQPKSTHVNAKSTPSQPKSTQVNLKSTPSHPKSTLSQPKILQAHTKSTTNHPDSALSHPQVNPKSTRGQPQVWPSQPQSRHPMALKVQVGRQ